MYNKIWSESELSQYRKAWPEHANKPFLVSRKTFVPTGLQGKNYTFAVDTIDIDWGSPEENFKKWASGEAKKAKIKLLREHGWYWCNGDHIKAENTNFFRQLGELVLKLFSF